MYSIPDFGACCILSTIGIEGGTSCRLILKPGLRQTAFIRRDTFGARHAARQDRGDMRDGGGAGDNYSRSFAGRGICQIDGSKVLLLQTHSTAKPRGKRTVLRLVAEDDDGGGGAMCCSGLNRITGGFALLLLLQCSVSAWGQDSISGKQKVIAWTLELEQLLKDISLRITDSANQSEASVSQISDEIVKDEQHSNESEKKFDEQVKISEEQERRWSELSSLFSQSEAALRASQSATELAVSVAVILGTAAIVEGLILIFRN